MNMINPENFEELRRDAQPNPALARLMKAWEEKMSKNAKRATGFGLVAVSLAACGGSSTDNGTDPEPIPEGGTWSLLTGRLELAGDFDPDLFAGGAFPTNLVTIAGSVLTPTEKKNVMGDGNPADGDDLVLATSGSFIGAVIDLGEGTDTIFLNVDSQMVDASQFFGGVYPTNIVMPAMVQNVEIIEIANAETGNAFGANLNTVNLGSVFGLEQLIITETTTTTSALQVTNIRGTNGENPSVTLRGNFNQDLDIDFLNATGPLSLILDDYFQNGGTLNFAQDFSIVNLTSTGEGILNAFDAAALGDNLQQLNIDGGVDFEVITGASTFRPNTMAQIDASAFTGENLSLTVNAHNNVSFVGSDANDWLNVTMAQAAVGPDTVIRLTVDMGEGSNTVVVNGSAGQALALASQTVANLANGVAGLPGAVPANVVAQLQALQAGLAPGSPAVPVVGDALAAAVAEAGVIGATAASTALAAVNAAAAAAAGAAPNGFVVPTSTIASDGSLHLQLENGALDFTQTDAAGNTVDVSAATSVSIGLNAAAFLTAEQVESQVGIANFFTQNFGGLTGRLVITEVGGDVLDLSDIDVGLVADIITVPGDVVLDPDTILGNQNAGVARLIVDNRGQDSSVTISGAQFTQMDNDQPTITSLDSAYGGLFGGTNNPLTGQPYETTVTVTDLGENVVYDLANVATTFTTLELTDFTAGPNFAVDNIGGTEVSIILSGDVDLTAAAPAPGVTTDNLVFTDGASLTYSDFAGNLTVNDDYVFEGAATINFVGLNENFALDTGDVVGDASLVTFNFEGTGTAALTLTGPNDLTLKAVNAGDDIAGPVAINNTLDAGATFEIAGGSPAMSLGENVAVLNITGAVGTTTLIGTDPDHPGIVSDDLTNITTNAGPDAVIDLGVLSVTSPVLTVAQTAGAGSTTVEIAEVPAGANWTFNGVELVINDVSEFGAGSTILLGAGTTISGDAALADIVPFLAPGSNIPLDSTFSAAELDDILQALTGGTQATVNLTDMDAEQLAVVIANSLKVTAVNGDLVVTDELSVFQLQQLDLLAGLAGSGIDDLTVDAAGMTDLQKAEVTNLIATVQAAPLATVSVINLTLDSDDAVPVINALLPLTANVSTVVEADGMGAPQLNAVAAEIGRVQVINDMTLTNGNDPAQITSLLSRTEPGSVTVDADTMDAPRLTAIVQQISKIAVVEDLTVTETVPAELFQLEALLELAVDAEVDATNMSAARLSIVVENIDNIADDGISNLTVTADQTAEEIAALLGKADSDPVATAQADLSDMDADQIAAVVANAANVAALTVGRESTATLTLAELAAFEAAGLVSAATPLAGAVALDDPGPPVVQEVGGSVTIVAAANGTLDLALVTAGASAGTVDGGTLTLEVPAGVTLTLESALLPATENLVVTGSGTVVLSEDLDLSGLESLSVDGDITFVLASGTPGSVLTLTDVQANALAADGVTIDKAAAVLPATEGQVVAQGGPNAAGPAALDRSGFDFSLVDVLFLNAPLGTILPAATADLPGAIVGAQPLLVTADREWGTYTGDLTAEVVVRPDATLTISAATAESVPNNPLGQIVGDAAGAVGQTGGSIEVILDGVERNLSNLDGGTVVPGAAGPGDAGTFTLPVSANVELHPNTVLPAPATADVVIAAGATLTVNNSEATQADVAKYEGLGTLEIQDLTAAVSVTDDVRFNVVTFESSDSGVTIDGFVATTAGGFNGRFLFDDTGPTDVLGAMRLDLSSFTTNGSAVIRVADFVALDALTGADIANAGVIIIEDGADPNTADFGTLGGTTDRFFLAYEDALGDVQVDYWVDTLNTGVIDNTQPGELVTIATINTTVADFPGVDQLGAQNFVL